MEYKYYLAVFNSKNHAIYLHQYLRRMKHSGFELVSTPCKITAGCSYSIKFNDLQEHTILLEAAEAIGKPITAFYEVSRSYGRRIINKLTI